MWSSQSLPRPPAEIAELREGAGSFNADADVAVVAEVEGGEAGQLRERLRCLDADVEAEQAQGAQAVAAGESLRGYGAVDVHDEDTLRVPAS
ncbi:hypothetical protein [Enhygromyxa salina]|uniref:hypothetical protein n=1 Tax=Enhygromyxa salina TaxID=215803 RepID=UPI000D02CBCE|nr:hypothetical protein [Enhygromyxa salina]